MSHNHQLRRRLLLSSALAAGSLASSLLLCEAASAQATPSTPTVKVGTNITFTPDNTAATVTRSAGDGAATTVDGAAPALTVNLGNNAGSVIEWNSFNVGTGNSLTFQTALGNASVLNRVTAPGVSLIDGTITANNVSVWLVNPSGVTFGANGAFSGGALMLSTAGISDADFSAGISSGSYPLAGAPDAVGITITSGATISGARGVAAIAQFVDNAGTITSGTGQVALVAARDVTLNYTPGGPLGIAITAGTRFGTAAVTNSGDVTGTSVKIVGASNADVVNNLLNITSGTLTATGANGRIVITTKDVAAGSGPSTDAAAVTTAAAGGSDGLTLAASLAPSGGVVVAGSAIALNSSVTSVGSQSYAGNITLGANTTLASTGNGAISLGQVNGATHNLTVTTGAGDLSFSGFTNVGTLAATTAGAYVLNGGNYFWGAPTVNAGLGSVGAVTLNGTIALDQATTFENVTLGSDTTINGAAVTFDAPVDSSAAGARSLTVQIGATFNDPVGNLHPLSAISISGSTAFNAAGSLAAPSVVTTGNESFLGLVSLGDDTVLNSAAGNGAVTLAPVTGNTFDLTVISGSGAQSFSGLSGLGALSLTTSGVKTLHAGDYEWTSVTANGVPGTLGAVTLDGPNIVLHQSTTFGAASLASNVTVNSSAANGALTFGAVTGNAHNLTLTSGAGAQAYNGLTDIGTLTLTTTGTKTLNAGTYSWLGLTGGTLGAVTANGTLTLGQSTTFGATTLGSNTVIDSSAANGALIFGPVTGGNHDFTVTSGSGGETFNGLAGIDDLSLTTTGLLTLNTGTITTTGSQTYSAALSLNSNTVFDSSAGNGFIALGPVTGNGFDLTVTSGAGAQTYNGLTGINALVINASGLKTLNAGTYNWASVTTNGTPGTLGAVTTNGTLFFGQTTGFGAVTLGSDTVLNSSAANGALTLGPVTGNAHNLTLISGLGAQSYNGLANIDTLTLTNIGTRTLNAGTYSWNTLTGGTLGAVTTNGAVTLGQSTTFGATTLGSNVVIDSAAANGALTFGSVTGNAHDLTVTSGAGAQTYNGLANIGALTLTTTGTKTLHTGTYSWTGLTGGTLGAVVLDGTITLGQTATFGATALASNVTVDASAANAALTFGPVAGNTHDFAVASGLGAQTYNGIANIGTLTLTTGGTKTLNAGAYNWTVLTGGTLGTVITNGMLTLGQSTTLGATTLGSNTAIDSSAANGTLIFGPVTGGNHDFTVTSGSGGETFNGLTGIHDLSLTTAGPLTLGTGNITTTGNQSYNANVVLDSDTVIDSSAGNGSILLGPVTGNAHALTVASGAGGQTYNGLANIGALTLTTTGTKTLDAGTYSWASLAGGTLGTVTTNGTLTLGQSTTFGATTLGSNTVIDSSAANGAVAFGSVTGGNHDFAVTSGAGGQTYNGLANIGALTLATTAGKTLNAGAYSWGSLAGGTLGIVTTNGMLTLGQSTTFGATTLGSNTVIDSSAANGAVAFGPVTGGNHDFTVISGTGGQTYNGLAAIHDLSLTTSGLLTLNTGTISTTGGQSYNGNVVLNGDTVLASTGGVALTFAGTIDSDSAATPHSLTTDTSSTTTMSGNIGQSAALNNLLVNQSVGTPGAVSVLGDVAAAGAYQVTGSTLALGGGVTQRAAGNVTLLATGGDVTEGPGGLTLRSTGGALGITSSTGAVAMGASTLSGAGAASVKALAAGKDVSFGTVSGASLDLHAGGGVTGTSATATAGNALVTADGSDIKLDTLSVTGGDATVNARINVSGRAGSGSRLSASVSGAGADILVNQGAGGLGSAALGTLSATGGDIAVKADGISILSAAAGGAVTLESDFDATLGTGSAGGALTVTALDNVTVNSAAAGTSIALLTTRDSMLGTGNAGSSIAVTGANASLGSGAAGTSVAVTADGGIATVSGAVSAGGTYQVTGGLVNFGGGVTQQAVGAVTILADQDVSEGAGGLTLKSTGGALSITSSTGAVAMGASTLSGAGATSVKALTAGKDVSFGTVSGASLDLHAGGGITGTSATATAGNALVTADGSDVKLDTLNVTGGDATVNARINVSGRAGSGSRLSITATGAGADILVNQTAGFGTGSAALGALNAGGDILARAALDASVTSATAGGAVAVTAGGAANVSGTVGAGTTYQVTGSAVTLGSGVTQQAGGAVTILATAGDVSEGAGGLTLKSTGGALSVTSSTGAVAMGASTLSGAGATSVKALTAGKDVSFGTVSGSSLDLHAGGGITGTSATATAGNALVTADGSDVKLDTLSVAGGDATVNANVNVSGRAGAGGRLSISATGTGSDILVNQTAGFGTGSIALGTLNAGGDILARATLDASVTSATAGGAVTIDGGASTSVGSANAGSTLTVQSTGLASVTTSLSGNAIRIVGNDFQVGAGATVTGTSITLVNRADVGAANGTEIGTVRNPANGAFAVSQAELGSLNATTVVIETDQAGSTPQSVKVGDLALSGGASTSRFAILTKAIGGGTDTAPITLGGAITGNYAGTLQIGGDTAAAPTTTSAISASITADITAANVLLPGATVDLRAKKILFGLPSLLNDPTIVSGDIQAINDKIISNANSALFFGGFSGNIVPSGVFLKASSLRVKYQDLALFQNTGVSGTSIGTELGPSNLSAGGPVALSLDASGSTLNAFALFGKLNGFIDRPAGLLPETVIQFSAETGNVRTVLISQSNSRVNGCVIGSPDKGCLVTDVPNPSIRLFDERQAQIFNTADDNRVVLDPLIGTNNEGLIGDIASPSLSYENPECISGASESCPVQGGQQ